MLHKKRITFTVIRFFVFYGDPPFCLPTLVPVQWRGKSSVDRRWRKFRQSFSRPKQAICPVGSRDD